MHVTEKCREIRTNKTRKACLPFFPPTTCCLVWPVCIIRWECWSRVGFQPSISRTDPPNHLCVYISIRTLGIVDPSMSCPLPILEHIWIGKRIVILSLSLPRSRSSFSPSIRNQEILYSLYLPGILVLTYPGRLGSRIVSRSPICLLSIPEP